MWMSLNLLLRVQIKLKRYPIGITSKPEVTNATTQKWIIKTKLAIKMSSPQINDAPTIVWKQIMSLCNTGNVWFDQKATRTSVPHFFEVCSERTLYPLKMRWHPGNYFYYVKMGNLFQPFPNFAIIHKVRNILYNTRSKHNGLTGLSLYYFVVPSFAW